MTATPPPLQSPSTPETDWMRAINQWGVPLALIVFGCALVWRSWPRLLDWFSGQIALTSTASERLPKIAESLEGLPEALERLKRVEADLQRLQDAISELRGAQAQSGRREGS